MWEYWIASSRGVLLYASLWEPELPARRVEWIVRPSSRLPKSFHHQSSETHFGEFGIYWQTGGANIRLPHYTIVLTSFLLPVCWLVSWLTDRGRRASCQCFKWSRHRPGNTTRVFPPIGSAAQP